MIGAYFNMQRLLVVVLSFFVSLVFGWLFYFVFAKDAPFGIDIEWYKSEFNCCRYIPVLLRSVIRFACSR